MQRAVVHPWGTGFAAGRGSALPRVLLRLLTACVLLLASRAVFALEVPPLQGRVNDHAQLLKPAERQQLEARLAQFEQATGNQFALLTVPSLEGDPIEDFSIRVAEAWKLGDAQKDNGLILLVALQERKVRIEVGYGLEGNIPDAVAGRVIRQVSDSN